MLHVFKLFQLNSSQSSNYTPHEFHIAFDLVAQEISLFLALPTVLINIFVFYKLRQKDNTYKFLLTESIVDLVYLLLLSVLLVLYCGTPCDSISNSLFAKLYSISIDNYFSSCLAFNNILIQLFLSIQRLFIIKNKCWLSNISFWKISIFIIVTSICFYAPLLPLYKIVNEAPGQYSLQPAFDSTIISIIPTVLSSIRLALATIGLFSINLVTFVHFSKHIKKKSMLLVNSSGILFIYNFFKIKV